MGGLTVVTRANELDSRAAGSVRFLWDEFANFFASGSAFVADSNGNPDTDDNNNHLAA